MKAARILYHLARADFFERTRRYSFLLMLGLVLWAGYAMASGQFRMTMGTKYVAVIDSGWVGATLALTTSALLGMVGFYVVRGSVARDYSTGVGQIMAATPMSRPLYMLGKWLSNYAVLGIAIAVLALAGVGMALWFGQGGLDLVALLAPLVVIGLPCVGLVAALAVLFDSAAWLRGGFGNIVYIVLFTALIAVTGRVGSVGEPGFSVNPYVDFAGWQIIGHSVAHSAQALYPDATLFGFGGIEMTDDQAYPYLGIQWTGAILASRLLLLLVAAGLVMLSGAVFDRFDPARLRRVKGGAAALEPAVAPAAEPSPVPGVHLTALPGAATRFRFRAVLAGELKLLIKGQRWWWYAVAAGLVVGQLASPSEMAPYLLIAAWVWPVMLLSRLGCRENAFDTRQIVFSAPRPMSQLPAGWLPAVLLTAVLGSGALVRFVLAGDLIAVLGWLTAIVFIPSLALALGALTGSGRVFEMLYVVWMYGLSQMAAPAIDFPGLLPGSPFYLYAPVAVGLLAVAGLARRRQLQAA